MTTSPLHPSVLYEDSFIINDTNIINLAGQHHGNYSRVHGEYHYRS